MIDTDKYEGHTPEPWHEIFMQGDEYNNGYDDLQTLGFNDEARQLIADAPLLLAEVKRLREEIKDYDACLQNLWDNELIPDDTDIWDEVKELLEVD